MHFRRIILSLALPLALAAQAQSQPEASETDTTLTAIARQYEDSLGALKERYGDNWKYEGADTLGNPYYFYLFSSPTFYGSALHNTLGTLGYRAGRGFRTRGALEDIHDARFLSRPRLQGTDAALLYVYTREPWLVWHLDTEAADAPAIIEQAVTPQVKLSEKVEGDDGEASIGEPEVDIEVRKPNFWTFKGDFAFQLMQNYVSDNWYKGGESHHSMLASVIAEANYDNKQKITFNNKLEMKLGFQNSPSDERHKYKTNTDLLRLTNEFGLKATKHWYYSAMLQSWTQFYRGYKKNDDRIYSDFMSPFESLLTLGMKYSYESENKRFKVDVNLSPFAAHLLYVGRPSLEETFGLHTPHHSKFEYGSNITATHSWTICKNVNWKGRFYYYTNYNKTQIEWENTFNLQVNKFLSTQLFLYPRFDDGVKRSDPDASYFQFNEYLSVGLKVSI